MKSSVAVIIPICAAVALLAQSKLSAGDTGKGVLDGKDVILVEPAVSAINGKFEGFYGDVNGADIYGLGASISLPVGERYGFQFDSLYTEALNNDVFGAGGHFFTRRPDVGLLGVAFYMADSDDYSDGMIGIEGERYLDQVTLGGFIGYNNYDTHINPAFLPSITNETDYVAGRLYAAIYPTDDLMIRLEYQHRFDLNFFIANLEYQTPIRGVSLFADGGLGENGYSHLMGGVRIYFGDDKSLKDRHRKDDPSNILTDFINTGVTGGSGNAGGGGGGENSNGNGMNSNGGGDNTNGNPE